MSSPNSPDNSQPNSPQNQQDKKTGSKAHKLPYPISRDKNQIFTQSVLTGNRHSRPKPGSSHLRQLTTDDDQAPQIYSLSGAAELPQSVTHARMTAGSGVRRGIAPIRVASMSKGQRGSKNTQEMSPIITQKYESETSTKGLPGNQTTSGLRNKSQADSHLDTVTLRRKRIGTQADLVVDVRQSADASDYRGHTNQQKFSPRRRASNILGHQYQTKEPDSKYISQQSATSPGDTQNYGQSSQPSYGARMNHQPRMQINIQERNMTLQAGIHQSEGHSSPLDQHPYPLPTSNRFNGSNPVSDLNCVGEIDDRVHTAEHAAERLNQIHAEIVHSAETLNSPNAGAQEFPVSLAPVDNPMILRSYVLHQKGKKTSLPLTDERFRGEMLALKVHSSGGVSSDARNGELSFRKAYQNVHHKNDLLLSSIVSPPRQMTYHKFSRPNTNKNAGGRANTLFDNFKGFGRKETAAASPKRNPLSQQEEERLKPKTSSKGGPRNKLKTLQRRLESQERERGIASFTQDTTTPSVNSKTFAGGFGGVGSVYTHAHISNARKSREPKGLKRNWMQNHPDGEPYPDEPELKISGNKTGFTTGFGSLGSNVASSAGKSPQLVGMTLPIQKIQEQQWLDQQKGVTPSRSPCPIDPVAYQAMQGGLPTSMRTSQQNLSHHSPNNEDNLAGVMNPVSSNGYTQIAQFISKTKEEQLKALKEQQRQVTRQVQTQHGQRSNHGNKSSELITTRDGQQQTYFSKENFSGQSLDRSNKLRSGLIEDTRTESADKDAQSHQIVNSQSGNPMSMSGADKLAESRLEGTRTKQIATLPRLEEDEANRTEAKPGGGVIGISSGGTLMDMGSMHVALQQKSSTVIDGNMDVQISKINIEVSPTEGTGDVVHGSGAIQTREPINYSNLTNYHMHNNPVFGENQPDSASDPQEDLPSATADQPVKQPQFQPVLKSSYLNKSATRASKELTITANSGQNTKRSNEPTPDKTSDHVNRVHDYDDYHGATGPMQAGVSRKTTNTHLKEKKASVSIANQDLEAVTDNTLNSQQIQPLDNQQSSMHVMMPNYEEPPVLNPIASSHDGALSDPDLQNVTLKKLMQTDATLFQKTRPDDYALMDFVQKKTQEFLVIQDQLKTLDYNSLESDRKTDKTADLIMKKISLAQKARSTSLDLGNILNHTQMKEIAVKAEPPRSMIFFKNKSEETRYMRVAKCIMTLYNPTNQKTTIKRDDDYEYIYMKIFRFLADLLTSDEFESLSYYHVSAFINQILSMTSDTGEVVPRKHQLTLRQFCCAALDLEYRQSKLSQKDIQQMLLAHESVKQLWHPCTTVDVGTLFPVESIKWYKKVPKTHELKHSALQDHIASQVTSLAFENSLNGIIKQTYYDQKENITRTHLTRLLKGTGQLDLNHRALTKESAIRRNKVMLEHVVASRNMSEWRDAVLDEIHQELREDERRDKDKEPVLARLADGSQ